MHLKRYLTILSPYLIKNIRLKNKNNRQYSLRVKRVRHSHSGQRAIRSIADEQSTQRSGITKRGYLKEYT